MKSMLISFLRNLEVGEKLKCKTHVNENNFKKFLDNLEISNDKKIELEKLFDEAIISAKEEFFELGVLVHK